MNARLEPRNSYLVKASLIVEMLVAPDAVAPPATYVTLLMVPPPGPCRPVGMLARVIQELVPASYSCAALMAAFVAFSPPKSCASPLAVPRTNARRSKGMAARVSQVPPGAVRRQTVVLVGPVPLWRFRPPNT